MKLLLLVLLLCPAVLLAQEVVAKKSKLTSKELREFYNDTEGRILTEWVEADEDFRIWRNFTNAGYATVYVEGKMEEGRMLFRKGFKHVNDAYPEAEKLGWYTYSGVDQKFFENTNRKMLKDNYALMRMQRFKDDDGEFHFCAIWVKFAPEAKK